MFAFFLKSGREGLHHYPLQQDYTSYRGQRQNITIFKI